MFVPASYNGAPYHIIQRGNRREDVFFCDADLRRYLELALEYSIHFGLQILACCLMTNHVLLVCIPLLATSLARDFKPVHSQYAQYLNNRLCICGRLWQDRFFHARWMMSTSGLPYDT